MFHSCGLTGGILLPVLRGVQSVLYPNPRHIRMVPELLYHTDCTVVFGTDFFLSAWAKVADPYDFRSVRMIVAGAERVRDETHETRSEEHTSELQSLMRISYAVFCLTKKHTNMN